MLKYVEHASSKARGLYLVTHTSTNSFAKKFLGPHHCSLTHYHKSNPEKVPRRSDVDVAESRVYLKKPKKRLEKQERRELVAHEIP